MEEEEAHSVQNTVHDAFHTLEWMYLSWKAWITPLSQLISCSQKLLRYDQISFKIEWEFPSLQFYIFSNSKRILPLERGVVGELWKDDAQFLHTRRDFDTMTATLAWGKSRSRATTSHLSEIITNNRYFTKNKARVAYLRRKNTKCVSGVRSCGYWRGSPFSGYRWGIFRACSSCLKRAYRRLVSKKIQTKISHINFSL